MFRNHGAATSTILFLSPRCCPRLYLKKFRGTTSEPTCLVLNHAHKRRLEAAIPNGVLTSQISEFVVDFTWVPLDCWMLSLAMLPHHRNRWRQVWPALQNFGICKEWLSCWIFGIFLCLPLAEVDFAGLKTCRQLTVIALVLTALTAVCHINPFDDVPTFVSEEEHIYSFFWKSSLKGHAHTVFKFWKPSSSFGSPRGPWRLLRFCSGSACGPHRIFGFFGSHLESQICILGNACLETFKTSHFEHLPKHLDS